MTRDWSRPICVQKNEHSYVNNIVRLRLSPSTEGWSRWTLTGAVCVQNNEFSNFN
jgi:hypothetical protein